jgi:hypothetical protein
MSKNKSAATTAPTAPDNSDAAAAADAPKKPTLAERVRLLEVKCFGHAPYDEPAE